MITYLEVNSLPCQISKEMHHVDAYPSFLASAPIDKQGIERLVEEIKLTVRRIEVANPL